MKKNITLLFLLLTGASIAQIPAGYYNSATGSGYTLKTQLYNIIKNHTQLTYGNLWTVYESSDARPDGKVWDIYSNCDFIFGPVSSGGNQDNGTLGNNECERYNREHTFPKSWFADATPMYTDPFHVMPTDKKVNGLRGNLAYGKVGTASYTSSNGAKVGNCVAPGYVYAYQVFEPADEYKGDIARNYFYMATCYQNVISGWNSNNNGNTVLDGSSDKVYRDWYLNLMKTWNQQDPVSAKEIARNNAIYQAQGNRNPYIDHPEWVTTVWGALLASESFDLLASTSVYPNPSNEHRINIESEKQLDQIELITINGQLMQVIKNPKMENHIYSLENLPQGFTF